MEEEELKSSYKKSKEYIKEAILKYTVWLIKGHDFNCPLFIGFTL